VPDFGYYDPAREEAIETFDAYKDFKRARHRWIEGAPVAALIIQQSFWVTHDTKVIDAQVAALERHRINPVVIFADRENITRDLLRATHPDLIVEDRHGSMWDSRALLEELDAPYLRPISMMASTIDEWRKDPAGLASRDVGMFMTLQESWGTIEPIVVGGMVVNIAGFQMHEPVPDGIEKFARRAESWIRLRQTPNPRKKLAIVYYNKSLGKGDLMRGSPTGAFLDGPESLIRTLPRLQAQGYALDHVPATADALITRIRDAMEVRQLYHDESLTVASLARALGSQEYRVRRAINQGLGYRNFNDFLHRYRLDEASARLRSQPHLPVLTIALDVGFGSIGPFNRAFRSRFGCTPTEYRGRRAASDPVLEPQALTP